MYGENQDIFLLDMLGLRYLIDNQVKMCSRKLNIQVWTSGEAKVKSLVIVSPCP